MKNKSLFGSLILLFTALIWGTGFAAQRAGMDNIEPFTFTAVRMALSAVFIGALALLPRRGALGSADGAVRRINLLGGVCCGCFLAAACLFQQVGIVTTTAGKAGFLTAMYLLLVPLLGFVLFRRRLRARVWLAVAMGVAGLYLLCLTESLRLARGDALECVCALFYAGHILCCDYFARRGDPLKISALQFAVSTLIAAVAAALTEQPDLSAIRSAAIPILYCGIVSGGIGYTLQMTAQRFTEPTVASLVMSFEAVFAVLAGALLLGERMSPREIAGCVVLFAAIILVQLPERRREAKA